MKTKTTTKTGSDEAEKLKKDIVDENSELDTGSETIADEEIESDDEDEVTAKKPDGVKRSIKEDILSVLPPIKEVGAPAGVVEVKEKTTEALEQEKLALEKEREAVKKEIEADKEDLGTVASAAVAAATQDKKNPVMGGGGGGLEDGLDPYFLKMTPAEKAEFKKVGEETAGKVMTLLKETKVKVVKILELIANWLKMIPGVNKYFLEQESKIKTDTLLKMKEEGMFDQPEAQTDENKIS